MDDLEHHTPLKLSINRDVSDGYRTAGSNDPTLALERLGSVDVQLKYSPERFEIYMLDKRHRKGNVATINLNLSALFDVVQSCRTGWEEAIESFATTQPGSAGAGQRPYRPYENAWDKPIDSKAFHKLASKLAVAGSHLFSGIFEKNRGTPLDHIAAKMRSAACPGAFALTVNTADFHIPWRMLYTHPHKTEELAKDGENFNPTGFWGYRHVIEQFTNTYQIKDQLLARQGKLGFGAALHDRIDSALKVKCVERHHAFIKASTSQLKYAEWTTKSQLTDGLSAKSFDQQVLYFLCHAEGAGPTVAPSLQQPLLELTDGTINAVDIRTSIHNRFEPSPPLIFINACRGGQLGTLVRHNFTFATEFLEQGAACVVGPQIEVPAVFAGEFGKRFFEQLIARTDPPPKVGNILRDLTREMWDQHRNPFGLVYSLYAGADCHVQWGKQGAA